MRRSIPLTFGLFAATASLTAHSAPTCATAGILALASLALTAASLASAARVLGTGVRPLLPATATVAG